MEAPIHDITPFTILDYPDHLACIVWLTGCSMRCSYCYNPELVLTQSAAISETELFSFLEKRRGRLDGVVFSGGECTAYHGLPKLCRSVKAKGFKVKIDTNGLHPDTISKLTKEGLVDYIALDYKAPQEKFELISASKCFDKFTTTLDLLIAGDTPFEVRVTYHSDLLDINDITAIAADLNTRGYKGILYLQNFINGSKTITPLGDSIPLHPSDLTHLPIKTKLRS